MAVPDYISVVIYLAELVTEAVVKEYKNNSEEYRKRNKMIRAFGLYKHIIFHIYSILLNLNIQLTEKPASVRLNIGSKPLSNYYGKQRQKPKIIPHMP
jgi:hypothetical protein